MRCQMKAGVSTACLYPMQTEEALETLAKMGIKTLEIFFNAPSELSKPFLRNLREIKEAYDCQVISVHPFLSGYEPFLFFTDYERRFHDGIEMYRPIFSAAAFLGASYVVFHGNYRESRFENARYFERYYRLYEAGKEFGVYLCQENVERCKSATPDFIKDMSRALGRDAKFVLDVKQAIRAKIDPLEMAKAMGSGLSHIHISDSTAEYDCLPIGMGNVDFSELIKILHGFDYHGALILELYRHNFQKTTDLYESYMNLNNLLP